MNRSSALLALGLLLALFIPARSGAAPSKDEVNLAHEAAQLNKTASSSPGEAAVIKRITKDFGITADQLAALRARGLSLGELTVVLALAQRTADGTAPANIDRVIALRSGPPAREWGDIAKQLGIKLGVAVSQVKKVNNEAHREMKTGHEALEQPQKEAAPSLPQSAPGRSFTGEGKDMTRGSAAK